MVPTMFGQRLIKSSIAYALGPQSQFSILFAIQDSLSFLSVEHIFNLWNRSLKRVMLGITETGLLKCLPKQIHGLNGLFFCQSICMSCYCILKSSMSLHYTPGLFKFLVRVLIWLQGALEFLITDAIQGLISFSYDDVNCSMVD